MKATTACAVINSALFLGMTLMVLGLYHMGAGGASFLPLVLALFRVGTGSKSLSSQDLDLLVKQEALNSVMISDSVSRDDRRERLADAVAKERVSHVVQDNWFYWG